MMPNYALERTAGSPALAAAAHRDRSAATDARVPDMAPSSQTRMPRPES